MITIRRLCCAVIKAHFNVITMLTEIYAKNNVAS